MTTVHIPTTQKIGCKYTYEDCKCHFLHSIPRGIRRSSFACCRRSFACTDRCPCRPLPLACAPHSDQTPGRSLSHTYKHHLCRLNKPRFLHTHPEVCTVDRFLSSFRKVRLVLDSSPGYRHKDLLPLSYTRHSRCTGSAQSKAKA